FLPHLPCRGLCQQFAGLPVALGQPPVPAPVPYQEDGPFVQDEASGGEVPSQVLHGLPLLSLGPYVPMILPRRGGGKPARRAAPAYCGVRNRATCSRICWATCCTRSAAVDTSAPASAMAVAAREAAAGAWAFP